MFKFTEALYDETLEELVREIPSGVVAVKYLIESDTPIRTYDFEDQENYKSFFEQFATSANSQWKSKTNVEWDFSQFPFRESSDILRGLYRILKTGGVYTESLSDEEAARIEEKYRQRFQKDSQTLMIFCAVQEDFQGEDVKSGFGVPDDMFELDKISVFFERIAWDGLMIVINPEYEALYVIAFTDSD